MKKQAFMLCQADRSHKLSGSSEAEIRASRGMDKVCTQHCIVIEASLKYL